MKQSNKRFIRLKITENKTKRSSGIGSHKLRRIFRFIEANKFLNCRFYIYVKYPDGGENEGTYDNKEDMLFALSAFLED